MTGPSLPEGQQTQHASYWMTSEAGTPLPGLTTDLDVDVAVVGGGVAGLSTAYEVLLTGRSVAVLEAGRVAASVTGHTTAKVTALQSTRYSALRSAFGAEVAALYAQSQADAVARIAALTAELGISCELEPALACTYTTEPDRRQAVEQEAEAAAEAGLPVQLAPDAVGYEDAVAAVVLRDQLQFHPRKYLLGLAQRIAELEGLVLESSRVVRVDAGDPCVLRTEHGHTVRAGHVVIATNYPMTDRAMLFPRLKARRELVVAGPIPLDADPHGMFYGDDRSTRSVRTSPLTGGRRLLVVTGQSFTPGEGGDLEGRYREMEGWARSRFPLEHVSHRWAAQDANSPDLLPFVGPTHGGKDRVHVATGFGGWGMTNGVMAGRLLAAVIAGDSAGDSLPWQGIFDAKRFDPRKESKSMAQTAAVTVKRFVGPRISGGEVGSAEEIPAGSGAVVRNGPTLCAVHRDDRGVLRGVSARCTHLGCIVRYAEVEQQWQCPCHGSRFAPDGTVLQGPANAPLAPCGHDHSASALGGQDADEAAAQRPR